MTANEGQGEPKRTRQRAAAAVPKQDRKTGKWGFVIDGGIDPRTGKRKQIRRRSFATRKAAQATIDDLRHDLKTGGFVPLERVTVSAFLLNSWLPTLKRSVESTTLESYARNVRLHVIPHIGGMPLQSLTAVNLNDLYSNLLEN